MLGIISPHTLGSNTTTTTTTTTSNTTSLRPTRSHTCTISPGLRICTNCPYMPARSHAHTPAHTLMCSAAAASLLSPFLWCTLRQVSAELLRRQAGKQAHQQRGRGAVSLMSSKAVSNTRIAMSSCICAHVYQPRVHCFSVLRYI